MLLLLSLALFHLPSPRLWYVDLHTEAALGQGIICTGRDPHTMCTLINAIIEAGWGFGGSCLNEKVSVSSGEAWGVLFMGFFHPKYKRAAEKLTNTNHGHDGRFVSAGRLLTSGNLRTAKALLLEAQATCEPLPCKTCRQSPLPPLLKTANSFVPAQVMLQC